MRATACIGVVFLLSVHTIWAGAPPPDITNTIEYNGREYATTFNNDPYLTGTKCQSNADIQDASWELAENNADTRYVLQHSWETSFALVADGSSYHTGPINGGTLYKGPSDDCGPKYPVWPGTYHYRVGCLEIPFWCDGDFGSSGCRYYFSAFCDAVVLLSRELPGSPDQCSAEDRSTCSEFATCDKMNGQVSCTCIPGFSGDGTTCIDIPECQDANLYSRCHHLAYCDETPGSFTCSCPDGFLGDGFSCANNAFGVRTVLDVENVADYSALQLEALKTAYAMLILQDSSIPSNASVITTMPANFGSFQHGDRILGVAPPGTDQQNQITLTVLFHSETEAQDALNSLANPDWSLLGATDAAEGPSVYNWVGGSTSDAIEVGPTGLAVDSVHFEPSCLSTGCWVVEVTYTAGNDDFNVFYLPKAEASDALSYDPVYTNDDIVWPKSAFDTFLPSNHPCTSMDYDASSGSLPASVTACCIPEFLAMYRPVSTFETALDDIMGFSTMSCGVGATDRGVVRESLPAFVSRGQTPDAAQNRFPPPSAPDSGMAGLNGVFVNGTFQGMSLSRIDHAFVADAYVGIYKATLRLDERELRTQAGLLRGTVGVEHTVDTFIGLANFGPTGAQMLDTGAVQINVHLEKTSFFSVSTHGTNDYTFLEYVNVRLIAIYVEDSDFSGVSENSSRTVRTDSANAAHYLQVTFTLGAKYAVNENSGLIPLDSVRAGRGQFLADASMEHKCSQWTAGSLPLIDDFNTTLLQTCAPAAAMCDSPASIPDSFVSFNVPLGTDFLGSPSAQLDNNVFIAMVISAVDTDARDAATTPNDGEAPWQMKTTLSASIPVVEGGVNIFCDGVTAKTDLKDVANADIVVGSAKTREELTRLTILQDIASTQLSAEGPAEINTDSIEAGLMTLVLKGNGSYFDLPGNRAVSIELEDAITIHLMEDDGDGSDGTTATELLTMIRAPPADNSNSGGLDTDGYPLNGAVGFTVDRRTQRAHLEPSAALLELCPWNPNRPMVNNAVLVTCVTRRDVRNRGYPKRAGGVSTAMEICPAADPHTDQCDDDHAEGCCGGLTFSSPGADSTESEFLATILGESDYSHQLAVDFAKTIDNRYQLNGRYRRAYWINPGYEWSPTQTGGGELFSLSQKVFVLALITLDENIATSEGDIGPSPSFSSRRMLLQSDALDPLQAQNTGAAAGQSAVSYSVTPTSMMANAFKVPRDHVASFAVSLQLTTDQACLPADDLQATLRDTLDEYLLTTATEYHTVQVVGLTVSRGDVGCGRRRGMRRVLSSAFSTASVDVRMLIVFADTQEAPRFNQALFATMPGVNSVAAASSDSSVQIIDVVSAGGAWWSPSASDDSEAGSGTNIAMLAGAAGGAAVLAATIFAAVFFWRRSRTSSSQHGVQDAVQAISVDHLKGELSMVSSADELKRELASEV